MYRLRSLRKVERASGASISNPSSRYIAITASVLFSNYSKITTNAFDSSGTDRWITWYRDGSGGFNKISSEYLVNNTQYDNNVGTLTALTSNYYANRWFYLVPTETGSQIHMVVGQYQYSKLVDAQAGPQPTVIPTVISELGILIGRIIVKEGVATLIQTDSAFTIEFTTAVPSDHNELTSLQGGRAGEYYHLVAPTAPAAGLRNIVAIDNGESARTDKALFDATNPAMNGTAAPGSAMVAARRDHVHASDTAKATNTAVFHKTTAAEFSALTAKTPAIAADIIPIEDSASSNAKKKITIADIPIDVINAGTDITTNNASTTKHGLVIKATAPASGVRNVVCIDNAETVYKNAALFDSATPANLGTASSGSSLIAARKDHVHNSQTVTASPWNVLTSSTDYSTTAPNAYSITMVTDQTANIKVGCPIRVTSAGTVQYAVCTAITSTLLTIAGRPLSTTNGDITVLSWGDSSHLRTIPITLNGYYAYANSSTLIADMLFMAGGLYWLENPAYLVRVSVINRVNDTGASQAYINPLIGGQYLFGSAMVIGTTLAHSVVDVTSYYALTHGTTIEFGLTKGTNGNSQDLTVYLTVVAA